MKKILMILICLLSIATVSAAEVCIIAQSDGWTKTKCVDVDENTNGYEAIKKTGWDINWADYGSMGHFLDNIEGITGTTNDFWNFDILSDNGWMSSPAVFDGVGSCWNRDFNSASGYYCAKDGDVLALAYGPWVTMPNMLKIDNIKIYVDNDKSSANEDGDRIKDVMPQSKVNIKMDVENLYSDEMDVAIEEISIEGVIKGIDDDDDIEEESETIDLDA
ncbi:MAG: hypothetical protein ABIJ08_02185, partial [Nanoarchaeota archaeon]